MGHEVLTSKPGRTRPRWRKRALWAFVGLGVAVLITFAAWPKPVAVDVAVAERRDLVVTVDEDGRTRVQDRYLISAPLSGHLTRIELEPGDAVRAGQALARISPSSAPLLDPRGRQAAEARLAAALAGRQQALARVESVRSSLAFAEQSVEQLRLLSQRDVVSERELERARLEVQTLRADLASADLAVKVASQEIAIARASLGRVERGVGEEQMPVSSPIDGRVLEKLQTSEGVVQAGTPLLAVGDPRRLEVVVDVLTRDAVLIKAAAPVTLIQWGGQALSGTVRLVEPTAFTRLSSLGVEEQRVNVIIDITSPPEEWAALGDGYRLEARIEVWRGENVLVVPSSAVFRSGSGWALFSVEAGAARLRPVSIGQRSGTATQIDEGLEEGAVVITHPSDRVHDGVETAPR